MVSPINFGSYQSFYNAYTPTRCSSYQNPVFTGYNNEPAKTNSKLTETQQWGIATVVAVGLAIVGDFVFAKGKHVKSILGMAEKEGANIKPKSSGTPAPTSTGSAPKPPEAPNPQPTGAPDVKPPEPVINKPQGQVSEEKPIIQQEQQVPNDYVPSEPKPIERPISNENQIPVEQPKPQNISDIDAELLAKRQAEFERQLDFSKKYVDEHRAELDKFLLDSEGRIAESPILINSKIYSFDDIIKPYKGNCEYFYHGTTPEIKEKILKEGFNQRIAPRHGYLDGVGGSYFALSETKEYGANIIKIRFNGKIAEVDTDLLNNLKLNYNFKLAQHMAEKTGMSLEETSELSEAVMREYLQRIIFEKGYQGIIGKGISYTAGCKYFSALDPKLIEIVK